MSDRSWDDIRRIVHERAGGCCEYCHTCEVNTGQTMQVDHIEPDGGNDEQNLALSCWNCNNHKRQATQAPDPETGTLVSLFHPRQQVWAVHFASIDNAIRLQG